MTHKEIKKRPFKKCSICDGDIRLIQYRDGRYRGGHYFGKIPLIRKKEWDRIHRMGTVKSRLSSMIVDVLKENPKPYAYAEYWECSRCYWRG